MAMEPRAFVRCRECNEQADLPVEALTVQDHPSGQAIAFSCPECGVRNVRAVTRAEVDAVRSFLERLGVEADTPPAPAPVPTLTFDDLLDFHHLLATTDAVAELVQQASAP